MVCALANIAPARLSMRAAMAATVAAICAAGGAQAQEWQNSITFYGVIPWVDTEVTGTGGNSVESLAKPDDIIGALDFTYMMAGEHRYGNVSFLHDVMYSNLGESGTLGGPFAGSASVDVEMLIATAALGYVLHEDDHTMLQGYGGIRYVSIETGVSAAGGGPVGVGFDASVDKDWVDPIVGLRGRVKLNDKVSMGGFANVGGFGAGSELSVDLFGGFEYAINARFGANFGFRYTYIDYEGDRAELKLQQYGPVLGLTVRF
jgi:outer membrane protein W